MHFTFLKTKTWKLCLAMLKLPILLCLFRIGHFLLQLLDIVRRLEAATTRGFSDGVEEGEAVALRLLVNVRFIYIVLMYLFIYLFHH